MVDPDRLRRHKDRAAQLAAKGKLEAALAEYLEALRVAPSDVVARQRAAELYARLGDPTSAIAEYASLVGKYAAEGHLLRAIATCQLILQLDPDHAATLTTLSELYAERDRPKAPVRMPSGMAPALGARPSAPPPSIDPATLARIPLFSELSGAAFVSLVREIRVRTAAAGEAIVEEGAMGDAFFAIVRGKVHVERASAEPRVIAEMGEGEFFGEMSLLGCCPRFATVTAATDVELLELSRAALERAIALHPRVGEVLSAFYRERLLANVLRASAVLRALPDDRRAALAQLFKLEPHAPGVTLLAQGDRGGSGFYLLLRGECDVLFQDEKGREEAYPRMREGDVFGEVSLLQGGAITATVRTATPCVVLALQREWFDELILGHPPARDAIYAIASQRIGRTQEMIAKRALEEKLV